MRAPIDWLTAALLIGLIGPAPIAAPTTGWLRPTGLRTPETLRAAIAQQSPIDIRGDDLQLVKKQDVPSVTFHYGTHVTVDLENTGSPNEEATVWANVAAGDGEIRVGDRVYRLVQFHWHSPAEHEVDEQRFPMEMHLVHAAADGSTLVIGVFLRAGVVNPTLAPIFSHLSKRSGDHTTVPRVNVAALIPPHEESARYTGSLTPPPFTEGVRWIVIAPPIDVSRDQIAAFAALFPDGNSRAVQPINGRRVATDDSHFERDEGVPPNRIH
jgi:carbonic anhydrase